MVNRGVVGMGVPQIPGLWWMGTSQGWMSPNPLPAVDGGVTLMGIPETQVDGDITEVDVMGTGGPGTHPMVDGGVVGAGEP